MFIYGKNMEDADRQRKFKTNLSQLREVFTDTKLVVSVSAK